MRKPLLAAGIFLLATLLALFALLPRFISPEKISPLLVSRLEGFTGGKLTFDQFQWSTFPGLTARMRGVSWTLKDQPAVTLIQADEMRVGLGFFAALFGSGEPSFLEIRGGRALVSAPAGFPVKELPLEDLSLRVSPLSGAGPVKFQFESGLSGAPKSLAGRGLLVLDPSGKKDWREGSFDASLEMHGLSVEAMKGNLRESVAPFVKGDILEGGMKIQKPRGATVLSLEGDFKMGSSSKKEMPVSFIWHLDWDFAKEEWTLLRGSLVSPLGALEASGRYRSGLREIQEGRLTATDVTVENLPEFLPGFKEAIPFHLGFSGTGRVDMSVGGTLDHLSFHANCDLTETLLNYSRHFSKPKGLPALLVVDVLLRDGRLLSGDFSFRVRNATLKGTLTNVDLGTGQGQINVITNKFDLAQWKPLLPSLGEYELGGEVKVLFNAEGALTDLSQTKRMLNLTWKNGVWMRPDGSGVSDVNVSMDYGGMALEMKELEFRVGRSQVAGELTVYHLFENPMVKMALSADPIVPDAFLASLADLARTPFADAYRGTVDSLRRQIAFVLPAEGAIRNFKARLAYQDRQWSLSDLSFEGYGGWVRMKGGSDLRPSAPSYWVDLELERIHLARYLADWGKKDGPVEGNFFLKARFEGQGWEPEGWIERLRGNGDLMMTNGEFHTFNVLGAIGKVKEFAEVNLLLAESTPFDDFHGSFVFQGGRFSTNDAVMISRDIRLEAKGDLAVDGQLNYRLDTYLSAPLTDQVLAPLVSAGDLKGDRQFGPIPLLLSGPLQAPDLKPDANSLAKLLDQLEKRKTHRVLRNFPSEDLFFGRRERS